MKKLIILFASLFLAANAFAVEPLTVSSSPEASAPAAAVSPAPAAAPAAAVLASAILEKVDFSVDLEKALEASAPQYGVAGPQDYEILAHYYPGLFSVPQGPDRVTASVLAILLGGLGVHHFYMGETALGILDILFCWTGIPSLVAFIDGVVWLCESNEEFYYSWLARNDLY